VDAVEAVAHARLGDLFNTLPHGAIVARVIDITIDGAR
jgi:hypothetical protein